MQSVDLNLATRPFKNDTLLWVGFLTALFAIGYATWWNVDAYRVHRQRLGELEQSRANLEARLDALDLRGTRAVEKIERFDLPAIALRAEKANEVIRWKSFSWTRLFNLLQEVQPPNVQMTSIHPVFRGDPTRMRNTVEDPDEVPVSVEGIAKSLEDFLAFERALIRSPHFERPDPDRHTLDENSGEWVFRLRFLYDPRVPLEEEKALVAEAAGAEEEVSEPKAASGDVEVGGETAAADGLPPLPGVEEEPSGVLASEKLKKIDRRGPRRRRGTARAAAGEEAPMESPVTAGAPVTAEAGTPAEQASPAAAAPDPGVAERGGSAPDRTLGAPSRARPWGGSRRLAREADDEGEER